MKDSISSFLKNLTYIAVILGAFGILITNMHLSTYNFPLFETINSRVVYVGFVFTLILIGHILVYAMFFDYQEIHKNNFLFIIIITILKVIVLTNILITIFCFSELNALSEDFKPFWSRVFRTGIVTSTSVVGILAISYEYIKNDNDLFSLIFKVFLGLGLVANTILFIYLFSNFDPIKEIYKFEFYFGFLFLIGFLTVVASSKDEKKGIKVNNDTFFSRGTDSRNILDKTFFYVYLIAVLLIITKNYSTNIYTHIDKDKGGGLIEPITLVTANDTINGNVILQSSEYFLIEKDSSLLKVKWDDIEKIIGEK